MRGEDEERDVVCSHVHEAHIRKKKKEREFLDIIINSKMLSAKMNVMEEKLNNKSMKGYFKRFV